MVGGCKSQNPRLDFDKISLLDEIPPKLRKVSSGLPNVNEENEIDLSCARTCSISSCSTSSSFETSITSPVNIRSNVVTNDSMPPSLNTASKSEERSAIFTTSTSEERNAIYASFPSTLSNTLGLMAKANHRLHGVSGVGLEVEELKRQWIGRSRAIRDNKDIASCLRPSEYANVF